MALMNPLLGSNLVTGPAPFDPTVIGNSVWLDGTADFLSAELGAKTRTKAVIGTWIQKTGFTTSDATIFSKKGSAHFAIRMQDQASKAGKISIFDYDGGSFQYSAESTTMLLRDIGWYHIMISIDTTASAGSRLKYYINGIDQTSTLTVSTDYTLNDNPSITGGSGEPTQWGVGPGGASQFNPCYLAQSFMLDDDSIQNADVAVTDILDAFTLGTNGSQFTPKADADIAALASSAGGDSFCLDFADSSDLGNDISANSNDFTPTSMSSANQSTNTPSLVYPSLSNIVPASESGQGMSTLTNGNLSVAAQTNRFARSAMIVNSTFSKLYYEVTFDTVDATYDYPRVGIALTSYTGNDLWSPGAFAGSGYGLQANTSTVMLNGSNLGTNAGFSSGDVYMCAFDPATGKIWAGKDGTYFNSGDPAGGTGEVATITGDEWKIFVGGVALSGSAYSVNFGQSAFAHTVPTGFASLASSNLTAPDYQGIDYFAPTLYEGNGTGQRVGDFVPFTDAYTVDNSAMFDNADLRYLARTPSSGGDEKTLTFSTWIKITGLGNNNENAVLTTDDGSKQAQIRITGTTLATKKVQANLYNGSSFVLNISTDRTFGDTSSWNHLVVAYDTRAAVASANKVIIYINGVRQSVSGTDLATDDYDTEFNSTNAHNIGRQTNNGIGEPDFYLAETVMIDGQQLDATSFGQLDTSTNRWVPKDVSGLTFGTNGFYLQYESTFASGSGAGTDTSGNSNNWTESTDGGSAWATSDQFIDTPSQNFATLDPGRAGSSVVLVEGNLKQTAATDHNVQATMAIPKSGKWAFTANIDATDFTFGIVSEQNSLTTKIGRTSTSWGIVNAPGASLFNVEHNSVGSFNTSQPSVNNKLIAAIDMDTNSLWLGYDTGSGFTYFGGGNPATGATPTYQGVLVSGQRLYFAIGRQLSVSFGGQSDSLYGTLPTDFLELNQDNLDDTASKLTALAWIKNRDATDSHILVDRVRGVGEVLHSNEAAAEATEPNTVQRFLQRGVQVGSDVQVNTANESYVLWQWLIGDSATTGTVNNDGSIPSTIIAADAGNFSVGTYTGQTAAGTVGHGLGGIAEMVIVWDKGFDNSIVVYHYGVASDAATDYLVLNDIGAAYDSVLMWNDTAPTSSVFSVGTGNNTNGNTRPKSFLAFRSVPGVCKVGSFVGNANANGPYIHTGFKPAFVLGKSVGVDRWVMHDTARSPINVSSAILTAETPSSEATLGTTGSIDMLSDGFKVRDTDTRMNGSGVTYIYLAMADIGGNGTLPPVYGR